jgi:hypothetical protein
MIIIWPAFWNRLSKLTKRLFSIVHLRIIVIRRCKLGVKMKILYGNKNPKWALVAKKEIEFLSEKTAEEKQAQVISITVRLGGYGNIS